MVISTLTTWQIKKLFIIYQSVNNIPCYFLFAFQRIRSCSLTVYNRYFVGVTTKPGSLVVQ
jgi:hypothetical protein